MHNRMNVVFLLLVLLVVALGGLFFLKGKKTPELSVPPSVSEEKKIPEAEKKEETKEVKKVVKKKRVVKRDAEGYLPYLTIGRNPYCPYRTEEMDRKILKSRRYTEEEIEEYLTLRKEGKGVYRAFFGGQKFLWVAFGKGTILEKLKAVWKVPAPGILYQLKTGRNIVVLDRCCNLAEIPLIPVPLVVAPPSTPPVVEVSPVVEVPTPPIPEVPPVVEVPLVAPQPAPPVAVGKKCSVDPNLFIGHEREPSHGGDWMEATDLTSAFYCLWQSDDPNVRHGFGLNFKGSWFEGRVNHGAGKFTGWLLAGGPAYKRVVKDKWDMEFRLLIGALHEDFRQGGFKNDRDFGVVGPSFIFNDYRRRAQGHKWFHETQWYWELLFPFTNDLSHSFNGQPLPGEPDGLDARFNVTFKEWLYDNNFLQPFFKASYFLEAPGAESLALRFGLAIPGRWLSAGVGPDLDLKNGGQVLGLGFELDATTGLRDLRRAKRAPHMTDVTGIGSGVTTSPDGFLMVPVGEDVSNSSSSSGQPNGVSGNAVGSPNLVNGSPADR